MATRIAKFLSDNGIASRRDAEKMIAAGRVAVNGAVVATPVCFVGENDRVAVDGKPIIPHSKLRTPNLYLFHKPRGTMCTARDPGGRRTIYDVLPAEYKKLKYIGRLDYNTSGLLLLTDDGNLAREMTLPSAGIERVYIAKLGRTMTMDDAMIDRLLRPVRRGIKIGGVIYRPMKIDRLNASDFKIAITEGKKNEIRIVMDHIGLPVRALHRISYGKYELGDLTVGKIVVGK
jgi:23S rRNA pseudouridine2605 synthase